MKVFPLTIIVLALTVVACDEEGEEHHHHAEGACGAIVGVCHDVDTGSGRIAECHDIGHDEVVATCEANRDECVALCTAAAADGGAYQHGEDGSAHSH